MILFINPKYWVKKIQMDFIVSMKVIFVMILKVISNGFWKLSTTLTKILGWKSQMIEIQRLSKHSLANTSVKVILWWRVSDGLFGYAFLTNMEDYSRRIHIHDGGDFEYGLDRLHILRVYGVN